MEKDKKKRSPNYTIEEKQNLLSLVAKYKGVIECKRTGAFYIQKKKEAWVAITKQYNSLCTTGPRDEAMLKHFYNNIKHRARKVSANENKQRYLTEQDKSNDCFKTDSNVPAVEENKENYLTESPVESSNNLESDYTIIDDNIIIEENIIQDLKKKWTNDKKNIKKTGGGSFEPILTDADHQVLAILDDQISPDENPYDEAAEYFGETIEVNTVEKPNPVPLRKTSRNTVPVNRKKIKNGPKTETINKSAELLKKIYFKKKIELVYYQKKNEMQKFRHEQKKHELELKKQELELKLLRKQLGTA